MKTTKRVFALVLAAMMLAMMIPFAASAANNSLTLSMSKDGFEYAVYQVATINTETGVYTINTNDTNVTTAMKTKNQSGKDFLAALDAASDPGTFVGTVKKGTNYTTSTLGIYYARVSAWPDGVQNKKNTVVVPQYTDGAWEFSSASIDLSTSGKATSGDISVDKGFSTSADNHPILMNGENRVTEQFKGQDDTVYFTLEATIVGSTDQKAKKYVIYDTMSKGLTYNNDAKVYYLDATGTEGSDVTADFTVETTKTNAKLTGEYANGTYITVTAKDDTLNGTAFYVAKKVRVVYSAKVNNDAKVGTPGNPNTDGLEYTNAAGKSDDVEGPEVRVYTYIVRAYKVDASNNNTPLAGATIGLFKTQANAAAGTSAIASGVTGSDGYAKFIKSGDTNEVRLAPGKYYVKETAAPNGYNLNTKVYEVTVNETTSGDGVNVNTPAITNTISKLPQTGGEGTMMFTIIGGSLILIAGALFVVVMKKKSSK